MVPFEIYLDRGLKHFFFDKGLVTLIYVFAVPSNMFWDL